MSRRFPVPASTLLKGLEWLAEEIPYRGKVDGEEVKGDTFPMTWARDGEIYTATGDPNWGTSPWGLDVEKLSGYPPDYTISQVNPMPDYVGWGGSGPKPTGMISAGGALYLAWQNFCNLKSPVYGARSQHGSDAVIACSRDYGRTWDPDIRSVRSPLFPGPRYGGPAFINFGRDNDGARDEYLYAVSADQWDNGGHLLLGRAHRDMVCQAKGWEWVCGIDADNVPSWTTDLDLAQAVLSDDRWISAPEMVWLASVRRYLLFTWRLNHDFSPTTGSRLIVYDSPEPWGPFSLVHYEERWETTEKTPYCPRLPLKWIESDGITGWLQFSGSWAVPQEHYRSHVRRFRLKTA